MENIFKLVDQLIEKKDFNRAIDELTKFYLENPGNTQILIKRGDIYYKLQNYTQALNDYNKALKNGINNKELKAKVEMISNIIKFQGSDIYGATNLNNDPWLDD
ncbi:MAG: tetratricopeptide repeat protein [Bacteroidales bacterium]